jgi:hypothetical protein
MRGVVEEYREARREEKGVHRKKKGFARNKN